MNIRFFNARLLLYNDSWHIAEGELHTKGDRITYIGDQTTSDRTKWDREIDCQNNLIIPGFKNAHTHSAMTFLRSYADDVSLHTWLNDYIFPMEKKLTPELVYWATLLAIMEYLSSGITANFDMYYYPEVIAQAAIDSGFRTVQTGSISNFSSSVQEMEDTYYKINQMNDLVSYILGFHAEYTASEKLMKQVADLADKLHSPVWFHNSETYNEVQNCKQRYGITPTSLAYNLGLYRYGGGGYHCVWLEEDDYSILKNHNIFAVVNPASNLKLCSGIAPVRNLIKHNIQVAIGTDGAASNNSLDMFKEIFLAAALTKMNENNPECINAEQVLYMATIAGARAMGLLEADQIKVGKKADIVLIDVSKPNMQPENNIINHLVYSASKYNVKLTMVNGNILYEDGKYNIGIDTNDIMTNLNSIMQKM